jgi:hypothetical protein
MPPSARNREPARPLKPPARLPGGYVQIWRALAAAEGRAGSRQALARELGVSTQTLQRILVRGDVPVFPETTNARVRHSWIRTLARLARRLGGDPRAWLTQVGIPWDADVQAIVAGSRTAGDVNREPDGGPDRSAGSIFTLPDTIEVGLPASGLFDLPGFQREPARGDPAQREPLPLPLPLPMPMPIPDAGPSGWSFGEALARILFGAVHPTVMLRFHRAPEPRLAEALLEHGRSIDCALGLLGTVQREQMGLEFIPIPGWHIRSNAVGVAAPSGGSRTDFPRWPAAIFAPTADAPPLMVASNSVAQQHLLGVCGVPADRLVSMPHDVAQTVRLLCEAAQAAGGRPVLFVDDELTCRRVAGVLEQIPGLRVREIAGSADWAPSYPLTLALAPHARAWKAALLAALEREAFGASERYVGRLYGEILAGAALPRILADPFAPLPPHAAPRLLEFPFASAAFLEALVTQLVTAIEAGITREVGHGPERRWAALLGASHARALVPDAWQPALERLPELLPEVAGPHCQSCSVTLDEHHVLETTDRYCRFCSEPDGRLKPRAEVRRLIAGWFARWQRGVLPEEAQRRAEFFMRSMPAWTRN